MVLLSILLMTTAPGWTATGTTSEISGNYSNISDQCDPSSSSIETSVSETWPSPVILSLYPGSIIAAGDTFTLTVDGNNFIPESRVIWDVQDRTDEYLSSHQMTALITAEDIATPGEHYVRVQNPGTCGGYSNIGIFAVRDNGQTFPLYTEPLIANLLKADTGEGSIMVRSLSGGLARYNLTLYTDYTVPFSFYILSIPSWVSDPVVTILDEHRIQITGSDNSNQITSESYNVTLLNISLIGTRTGSGYLQCILNSATADDGTLYGSGYTALPVEVRDLTSFNSSSGLIFPLPQDPDGDGLYEDINGNGRLDMSDVVIFFAHIDTVRQDEPWWFFDFDQNRYINLHDIIALFQMNLHQI